MKLQDLIDRLTAIAEEHGDAEEDLEVRLAHQPSWPFEYELDSSSDLAVSAGVVYIPEGRQIGYLPGVVARDLGWKE